MAQFTENDVRQAFQDLLNAREEMISVLNLPEPGQPGVRLGSGPRPGPASEREIAELERSFGLTFPRSYKFFLLRHNGFPDANLGTDFFSIEKILAFHSEKFGPFMEKNLVRLRKESSDGLVVFASSRVNLNTTAVFDSLDSDPDGEWPVIYLSKRDKVLIRYDNFVDFLEKAAANLRFGVTVYAKK